MSVVPTWYPNKAAPVDNDSLWGYDSEWVANANFTLLALLWYFTSNITTSDISEWTNLYYTEDRVTANSTVVWLGNTKADKTNVLELDNTDAYTPTADTHPATKGYVDNQWININWLTEESAIASWDELVFYDITAGANRKIGYDNLKSNIFSEFSIVPWESIFYENNSTLFINTTNWEELDSKTFNTSWEYILEVTRYMNNTVWDIATRFLINWIVQDTSAFTSTQNEVLHSYQTIKFMNNS